jgi:hypothetical protein
MNDQQRLHAEVNIRVDNRTENRPRIRRYLLRFRGHSAFPQIRALFKNRDARRSYRSAVHVKFLGAWGFSSLRRDGRRRGAW